MKNVKFVVSGMKCGGCVAKVEKELATLDDISSVKINLDNQEVIVSGEDSFSNMKIKSVLAEMGFPVSIMNRVE